LAQLERRQAAQGLGLRSDIREARDRLDTQLQAATLAVGRGDTDQAEQSLRYAEAALAEIERLLGDQ
jgi:hypothetical protein